MYSLINIPKNISWRINASISTKKHIFVMGAPRSGTTLLQTIISSHPDVSGSQRESGVFTYQDIFNYNRKYCDLDIDDIKDMYNSSIDIVNFFDQLAEKVNIREKGIIYLDKTPQHMLRLQYLLKHFPNSIFICIYRDGRDCYCSARNHRGVPQGKSVTRYAKYWKKHISIQLKYEDHPNLISVKYEDFVNNPESKLQYIMKSVGLNYLALQLDPDNYSNDRRSNQVEFKKLNQKVTNESISRWRLDMCDNDNKLFCKIAGEQLRSLGYI